MKALRRLSLRELLTKLTPGPWRSAGGYLTVRDPDRSSFVNTIYHIDELGQQYGRAFQAVPFARAEDAAALASLRNVAVELLDVAEAAALVSREWGGSFEASGFWRPAADGSPGCHPQCSWCHSKTPDAAPERKHRAAIALAAALAKLETKQKETAPCP